jgi:ABC-type transporter Mla MlaB component
VIDASYTAVHQEALMRAASAVIESHRSAATLYMSGELTVAGVLEAIARVEQLPEHVRALSVDLRGAHRGESDALSTLEAGLRNWRSARRGMTRVKLAPDMETNLVALKFAHQRWTPNIRRPIRASGDIGGLRFRDHRQAVVTRSLRERARFETR